MVYDPSHGLNFFPSVINIVCLQIFNSATPLHNPGNPYWRGQLSTVDLHLLTSIDQLHLILKILFTFYKTSYLNEEVNCTEPSPSVKVPCTVYYFWARLALKHQKRVEVVRGALVQQFRRINNSRKRFYSLAISLKILAQTLSAYRIC
jgi:hypothetical protein